MSPAPAHRKIAAVVITALLVGTPRSVMLDASCNRMREQVPMVILAEKGPWRCVEIPGFLIYSRLPDAYCQRFADELRQHNLQLAILGSEAGNFQTLSNQIPVVLRVSERPGSALSARSVQVYDDEVWQLSALRLANEEEVERLVSTITGLNRRAMTHNRQMTAMR